MINKFVQEIFEQPQVLENTLNYYLHGEGQKYLEKVSGLWEQGKFDELIFTGMGSSFLHPILLTAY